MPPGVQVTLLVGLSAQDRMYLRARLSLAGLTDVDEADTAERASACMTHRHYDVVFVSLGSRRCRPWSLVQSFKGLLAPPQAVVVMTGSPRGPPWSVPSSWAVWACWNCPSTRPRW